MLCKQEPLAFGHWALFALFPFFILALLLDSIKMASSAPGTVELSLLHAMNRRKPYLCNLHWHHELKIRLLNSCLFFTSCIFIVCLLNGLAKKMGMCR